jgi:uncharacterized protein YqhQ
MSAGPNGHGPEGNGAGPANVEETAEPLRLGGMALRNGLLIHGPTSWAVAARARDGEIVVASGPKPRAPDRLTRVPLLRGPLRLAEGFAFIPLARRRAPAARLPMENGLVLGAAMGATMLTAGVRRTPLPAALREALAAVIGLVPAFAALRDHDLAAYHGAEHKQIGGYETGRDPIEVPKEHGRCGSHLIGPMLLFSVAGQLLIERLFEQPGRLTRAVAGVGSVSLAVEVFAWSERHSESALAQLLRAPGTTLQRTVATREPTPAQMEVGAAALSAVLSAESAAG